MGIKLNIFNGVLYFYPSEHVQNTNWDAHGDKASARDLFIRSGQKLYFDG